MDSNMKKIFRTLCGPAFIGLLMLIAFAAPVSARTAVSSSKIVLPKSPLSTSVLVAQGIHNGTIRLNGHGPAAGVSPDLKCKPTPCALKNRQVSQGTQPNNETPIVANPKNNKQLLTGANDYNCPNTQGFYSSNNAGKKWSLFCMQNLAGQFGEGDPGVGYDLNGNSYITGIDSPNGNTGEIIFQKSSNNGGSWSAPAIAVNPFFSGGLTDKEWLQIDTNAGSPHANALYISVTQFAPNNNSTITVAHSTNGGSTWSNVQVDTTQVFPNVDQFSDLAVGKDGTVYVTWMRCTANGPTGDCGGTTANEWFSKSTDGGSTWSAATKIANVKLVTDSCNCAFYGNLPNTSERISNIPAVDVDNSSGANSGNLYTVFYNFTGTQMQVEVSTSTNGGSTWSAPVRVTTAANDEFLPWLTVSPTGVVGATWMDRRNDPSNVNYEEFGALSTNGSSFGTNFQLASQPSNPFNDGFGGAFIGDYTGNYWASKTLYAVWTDTRNGIDQEFIGGIKNNA